MLAWYAGARKKAPTAGQGQNGKDSALSMVADDHGIVSCVAPPRGVLFISPMRIY
jgi:hypothetical protein